MESVPDSEILLYTSPDGEVQLDVRMQQDTMWMPQQMMAELFQTSRNTLSRVAGDTLRIRL